MPLYDLAKMRVEIYAIQLASDYMQDYENNIEYWDMVFLDEADIEYAKRKYRESVLEKVKSDLLQFISNNNYMISYKNKLFNIGMRSFLNIMTIDFQEEYKKMDKVVHFKVIKSK